MHPVRIAELLQSFLIAPVDARGKERSDPAVMTLAQLESISTYIDILLRWNSRVNLTAIRDPEEIVTRHFGESLFAARVLFPMCPPVSPVVKDFRVADVGSGAGFPGVPLKLWNPAIHLTLIESNQKKATFLKELARALTLTNIDIQNTRAETLPPASFDRVTLRAVERFEAILPTAAALVRPTGVLALLIGLSQLKTAQSILPEFAWSRPAPIPQSDSRTVIIGRRTEQPVSA